HPESVRPGADNCARADHGRNGAAAAVSADHFKSFRRSIGRLVLAATGSTRRIRRRFLGNQGPACLLDHRRLEGRTRSGQPMPEPTPTSDAQDLELLRSSAVTAGIIAAGYFRRELKSWTKEFGSPVSEADIVLDRFLQSTLTTARPDYGWLSEESA